MAQFVYHSSDHDRTAGMHARPYKSIQAWKTKKSPAAVEVSQIAGDQALTAAQNKILRNLELAQQGKINQPEDSFENTLAYASHSQPKAAPSKEDFTFGDVIDVINPLQHLPIVGTLYRNLTGDALHPVSQIIGGALYGGPIGAVSGTINAISQMQTGKDLADLAISSFQSKPQTIALNKNDPEQQLNYAATALNSRTSLDQFPGSAMAFVDLSKPHAAAPSRSSGSSIFGFLNKGSDDAAFQKPNLDALPPIDRITSLHVSGLPPRRDDL